MFAAKAGIALATPWQADIGIAIGVDPDGACPGVPGEALHTSEVAAPDAGGQAVGRFVNRDHDSGTRLLFDQLLALHEIDPAQIDGAQQIEFTHAAVAAYVASGMADASFGVEAAARLFGPDFVRLLTVDYFFVCRQAFLETAPMQRVLDIMKGSEFQNAVAALPGYEASDTGSVHTVREFLHRMDAAPPRGSAVVP